MLVHIFGAKSSPSVAGYALRKTAKDNEKDFSQEAVDAVLKDFYVDDLLKSLLIRNTQYKSVSSSRSYLREEALN